jgi:putative salt-induced outer membrane protein YdiY
MSTENYVNHQLNSSKTKEAHQFSRANRFPKSSKMYQMGDYRGTEVIYNVPATSSKRTTTFGYGSKIDLAIKTSSPPPGSYNAASDF